MAEYTRLQNSFAAGYVDPTLHGLTNTDMYNQGLMECENYIPHSLGYLYRRPGTRSTGWSSVRPSSEGGEVRLLALKTPEGPMVVEIRPHTITFRREGVLTTVSISDGDEMFVDAAGGHTVTASVPWEGKDLERLDVYEFEGSLYIVHPDYPPHIVRNASSVLGGLSYVVNGDAPYSINVDGALDMDISDLFCSLGFTCTPVSFEGGKFGRKTEYPSCQTFKGGRWYLAGTVKSPATIYASKAPDERGRYRFGDFRLGRYYQLSITAKYTKTTVYVTNEAKGDIESVTYEDVSNDEVKDYVLGDVSDILDYEVPEDTHTDTTTRYEANNNTTSDPSLTKKIVVVTEATTNSLQAEVNPDDGIELTESDMYGSSVNWLLTQQRVIAGTDRSIWMDTGEPASPSTFDMVQTLQSTVSPVHPVQYGSMIIYVPGDRRSVRGFRYDDNAGGYTVVELSASARTLFDSDVVELALCEGRETILWVLLENGKLLSCTIGATFGWGRHALGGNGRARSMVAYHSDDGSVRLYLSVDRRKGDEVRNTIECLELQDLVQTKVFRLMDCQEDVSSMADDGALDMDMVSERYEGFATGFRWVLHDGWAYPMDDDGAYAPGIVSTENPDDAPVVEVGYPYVSRAKGLWQELPSNSQTSLGMHRRATSIIIQVYRSGNPYCGFMSGTHEKLEQLHRLVKANADATVKPELYTGLVKAPVPSLSDEMVHVVVEAEEPLPMTVLALETRYKLQEA